MYAGDYNDLLPMPSLGSSSGAPNASSRVLWIGGGYNTADGIDQDDWDPTFSDPAFPTLGLDKSPLMSFVGKSRDVFKCPSDTVTASGHPRVRTYSMNCAFGNGNLMTSPSVPAGSFSLYSKQSQIRKPTETWVFGEEHANSINDGNMVVKVYTDTDTSGSWVDLPSSWHNHGCAFAYSDGHANQMKWKGSTEIVPVNPALTPGSLHNISVNASTDAAGWNDLKNLSQVTTSLQ